MELKDKVVVVTGATGGIGSAVVRELVKENARLVLVGQLRRKFPAHSTSRAI